MELTARRPQISQSTQENFFRNITVGIDTFTILDTTLIVINKHIVKVIGMYAVCAVR